VSHRNPDACIHDNWVHGSKHNIDTKLTSHTTYHENVSIGVDFENILHLETSRLSATTTLLELPTLGNSVWFLMFVWSHAKVFDSFAGVSPTSQQNGI